MNLILVLAQVDSGMSLLKPLTVYGPLGIWAAVATVAVYYLFKKLKEEQTEVREILIKVTEMLTKNMMVMQGYKEFKKNQDELLFILYDIKDHWKSIPVIKEKVNELISLIKNSK